jgi:hypothetical protein
LAELLAVRPVANLWRATRSDPLSRGQREVVLRVVHDPEDSEAMAALRLEYDALRAVDDPRIRKAHGFYAGFGALALEYVDGVSLHWAIERARTTDVGLDVATVLDLGVEVAGALRAAHEAGVVHGRICADTVRLRRDGSVVVTDFALPLDRLVVLAPEQAAGAEATVQTDQWLLGALLAHLVLGEPLLGGQVGMPGDGRRDVDPWLRRVLARAPAAGRVLVKMLALDPRERYGSETLLAKDLLAAQRGEAEPPRRDQLARRLHVGRPSRPPAEGSAGAEAISPAQAAQFDASVQANIRTEMRPGGQREAAEILPPPIAFDEPAQRLHTPVEPRVVALPVVPGERIFTAPDLVQAVVDEEAPPEPPLSAVDEEPVDPPSTPPLPPGPRLIPDWAAAWALVLLLAVGLWAILTRIL